MALNKRADIRDTQDSYPLHGPIYHKMEQDEITRRRCRPRVLITAFYCFRFFFLLFYLAPCGVLASAGDMDPVYRKCLSSGKVQKFYGIEVQMSLSLKLQIAEHCSLAHKVGGFKREGFLGWSAADECAYHCMHWVSELRRTGNYSTLKYYGHWPYYRVYGLQEPASAIFSALNAVPHLLALLLPRWRMQLVRPGHYLGPYLTVYSVVAINAWAASSLYHTRFCLKYQCYSAYLIRNLLSGYRKLDWTTQYDYVSALALVAYGTDSTSSHCTDISALYYTFMISFHIALCFVIRRMLGPKANIGIVWAGCSLSVASFLFQVYQMIENKVSFGSHMKLCVTISVLHAFLWLMWLVYTDRDDRCRYVCFICQVHLLTALIFLYPFPQIKFDN